MKTVALLTSKQVAAMLCIPEGTLRSWRNGGIGKWVAKIDDPRLTAQRLSPQGCISRQIVQLARVGLPADQRPAANGLARAGHPVSYWVYLRLSFSRPSSGFFAVAAIPAARSFAIRSMSFTGTGLVSGKWTVPFRSS